ncbi:MAG: hypothetical protein GF331_13765 [Chitinivibrionales bacterium]|nr:hypothetical protein [Chitinivibrionales bacterium]
MRKRPLLFRTASGLLTFLALLGFGSCDTVLDSNDDPNGGSGEGVEATSWIRVNDTSVDRPFGGTYRVAIIDKGESQLTIVYYEETGDGVAQAGGGILPYEVQGDELVYEWSLAWFGEDPSIEGINYTGKDWYTLPADVAPPGGTMQIVGDTLSVEGGGGALEFSEIAFGLPADMVGTWDLDLAGSTGDMELGATSDAPAPGWGSLSYTFDSQVGSGYWQASGTTDGYFRQVYTEMNDDSNLEYWAHLTPYTLAGDTLTFYSDLAETTGGAYDYIVR